MDAHAYLVSLGWAGTGHSLDSQPYKQKGHRGLAYDPAKVGNNGNGLVKPLLVSQRRGRLGVGKKAHEPQAGNQWWLKGFETALGNIGKSESERSSGTATPVANDYAAGKHSGLYSFFVKGQQMQGTIGDLELDETRRSSRKRKSDVLDKGAGEVGVDASSKKQRTAAEFEQVGAYMALRDKDEKRTGRTEKPSPVEEFQQVGEYLEARLEKKNKKRKSAAVSTPAPVQAPAEDGESKEERRERRRRRREEKQMQRQSQTALAVVAEENGQRQSDSSETHDARKAARRSERKKRKAEKAVKSAR